MRRGDFIKFDFPEDCPTCGEPVRFRSGPVLVTFTGGEVDYASAEAACGHTVTTPRRTQPPLETR